MAVGGYVDLRGPSCCIKPGSWRGEVLKSPDESQSFAWDPAVLANLTLGEVCRRRDRRREQLCFPPETARFVALRY